MVVAVPMAGREITVPTCCWLELQKQGPVEIRTDAANFTISLSSDHSEDMNRQEKEKSASWSPTLDKVV